MAALMKRSGRAGARLGKRECRSKAAAGGRRLGPPASNSVTRGLATGRHILGGVGAQEGACVFNVLTDGGRQGGQALETGFVTQFVQEFHAHEFTVGPVASQVGGPVQAIPCTLR
eukprot:Opistho-2@14383